MQKVVRLLACCLILAGCTEEEQEFSGEIEAAALDLTQPVPGGTVYITCGPIEGLEMYPLDLDPFFKVRGGYEISTANREIVPSSIGMGPQTYLEFEKSINLPNTNFFISGLKGGCTAVFSAIEMLIRPGRFAVDNSFTRQIVSGSGANPIGFTASPRVDDEIWRRLRGREGKNKWLDLRNLRRNAIVLLFSYKDPETGYNFGSSVMILDHVIFADHVVLVKG
ncbi:MAG: hypothetical protein IOD01_15340 [Rhodobacter sp.]|nr:hypothetical protein [Rhodobacter sp.]